MITLLRRLFWLALLGGAGYAVWTVWQDKRGTPAGDAPVWPPIDPPTEPAAAQPAAAGIADLAADDAPDQPAAEPAGDQPRWVEPADGSCPDGFPIKANDNSGIYHVPGGRFYDRTTPERCYASANDAEADGYRAAKS